MYLVRAESRRDCLPLRSVGLARRHGDSLMCPVPRKGDAEKVAGPRGRLIATRQSRRKARRQLGALRSPGGTAGSLMIAARLGLGTVWRAVETARHW